MKDTGAAIRTAYNTLLGSITYNGKTVPFYDEEPFETVPDYYIVLTSVDQSDASTFTSWAHEVVVTLDVTTRENMRNSREGVDGISNLVLQALLPNYSQVVDSADFQMFLIRAESPGYLREQDGRIHINRKILRIFHRLTQK